MYVEVFFFAFFPFSFLWLLSPHRTGGFLASISISSRRVLTNYARGAFLV